MKVGQLILIIGDALPILERHGVLDSSGDFHEIPVNQWAAIAAEITAVVESHGIDVDDRIEKVINALPMIISLF